MKRAWNCLVVCFMSCLIHRWCVKGPCLVSDWALAGCLIRVPSRNPHVHLVKRQTLLILVADYASIILISTNTCRGSHEPFLASSTGVRELSSYYFITALNTCGLNSQSLWQFCGVVSRLMSPSADYYVPDVIMWLGPITARRSFWCSLCLL